MIVRINIRLEQESGESGFGSNGISFHEDANIGKINFQRAAEIMQAFHTLLLALSGQGKMP